MPRKCVAGRIVLYMPLDISDTRIGYVYGDIGCVASDFPDADRAVMAAEAEPRCAVGLVKGLGTQGYVYDGDAGECSIGNLDVISESRVGKRVVPERGVQQGSTAVVELSVMRGVAEDAYPRFVYSLHAAGACGKAVLLADCERKFPMTASASKCRLK